MPLCAQIVDADTITPRKIAWGWWHIECLTQAAQAHEEGTQGMAILDTWSYPSLQAGLDIEFSMGFKDPFDGEVLILNKGDRIELWRD